jgi:hypothetical protein
MRRTTKPVGIPISRFLSTRTAAASRIAERALSIIDSVHGSQRLPRIRVDSEGTLYRPGGYTRTQSGKAVSINISRKSQFPLVDFTQEVGHFLDHQAIGERGILASGSRSGAGAVVGVGAGHRAGQAPDPTGRPGTGEGGIPRRKRRVLESRSRLRQVPVGAA